jgi:hypothetical protein
MSHKEVKKLSAKEILKRALRVSGGIKEEHKIVCPEFFILEAMQEFSNRELAEYKERLLKEVDAMVQNLADIQRTEYGEGGYNKLKRVRNLIDSIPTKGT